MAISRELSVISHLKNFIAVFAQKAAAFFAVSAQERYSFKTISDLFSDPVNLLIGLNQIKLNKDSLVKLSNIKAELKRVREFAEIEAELCRKMNDRNFSTDTIRYILSFTNENTYFAIRSMLEDESATPSHIKWTAGYTTDKNARLIEDATIKRNYKAIKLIIGGLITDSSQIEDERLMASY